VALLSNTWSGVLTHYSAHLEYILDSLNEVDSRSDSRSVCCEHRIERYHVFYHSDALCDGIQTSDWLLSR